MPLTCCALGARPAAVPWPTPQPSLPLWRYGKLASLGVAPSNPVALFSVMPRVSEATSFPPLGPFFLEAVAACFGSCFKLSPKKDT